jgi:hypothetical protein
MSNRDVPIPRRSSLPNQRPVASNSRCWDCLCYSPVKWSLVSALFGVLAVYYIFAIVIGSMSMSGNSQARQITNNPGYFWSLIGISCATFLGGLVGLGFYVGRRHARWSATAATSV